MKSLGVRDWFLLVCGAVSLLPPLASHAQSPDTVALYEVASPLVRVALMRFESANEIWVRADPGGFLSSTDSRVCDSGSTLWKVRVQGEGLSVRGARGKTAATRLDAVLRLSGAEPETTVGICLPSGVWKFYRGALEIGAVDGHLRIINEVPLESYLRGVVGGEIGNAPLEALKAQAAAARTYALYSIGKWAKNGYDLRDTPDSQVYTGTAGERMEIDRAIAATEGQILLWKGKPAATLFCADCGGATTPPTLPDEFPLSAHDDDAHGTADKPSPPAWTVRYTPEQFAALLGKSDKAHGSGTLDAIDTVEADVSGRVRKLRVTWKQRGGTREQKIGNREQNTALNSNDPTTQRPNDPTRFAPPTLTPFNPPSEDTAKPNTEGTATLREITGNALRSLLGLDTLKSTLFTVKHEKSGDFVITGRGYGHGKGLCQTGAIALANQAFDYRAILNRYYAGAVFARIVYAEAGDSTVKSIQTVSNAPRPTLKP